MRLDTITLEDLRVTIDHLIELHGPKKEVTDFSITLGKGNTITSEMLTHDLRKTQLQNITMEDLEIPESLKLSMIGESFFEIHEKE